MNTTGLGILLPLQRDKKQDYAFGSGSDLALSCVRQLLMTQGPSRVGTGEMPWRTDFGSPLHLLRHAPADHASKALVQRYIADAFAAWLPNYQLHHIDVEHNDNRMQVAIAFSDDTGTLQTTVLPLGVSS